MSTNTGHGAHTIAGFGQRHGFSRSKGYELVRAGLLIARKLGSKTLIFDEDNLGWHHALPKVPAADTSPSREGAA
jgi:hypothetical protein